MRQAATPIVPLAMMFTANAAAQPVGDGVVRGPALEIVARWHSRYVSEGRDNLDGDDLYSVSGGLEWSDWAAGGWFGTAEGQDYREMYLFVERGFHAGPLHLYGRYSRLHFLAAESNDNELEGGAELDLLGLASAAVDVTYSTQQQGSFAALSLQSDLGLFRERLQLTPSLSQTYDFGYASPEHDGANSRQARVDATLRLTPGLRLVGAIAHSWAQADVERSGGGDLTWGTVGLATDL